MQAKTDKQSSLVCLASIHLPPFATQSVFFTFLVVQPKIEKLLLLKRKSQLSKIQIKTCFTNQEKEKIALNKCQW